MKLKLQKYISDYGIKEIALDSREVGPNTAFFAMRGEQADGNDYIEKSFQKGASIVFTDNPAKQDDKIIYLEDIRMCLALAAGILYPELPKNIIAVTGTNGKSSVVSYVHQILILLGQKSAALGTLGLECTEILPPEYYNQKNNLTTSDPIMFRKILHKLSEHKVNNVAFEASSHGLLQRRLGDVKATSAAFTSFSQDHLEYHNTMESYLHAKLILFTENLEFGANVVINSDIAFFDFISKFLTDRKISYSKVGSNGDLKIKVNKQSISSQEITCEFINNKYIFSTNIIGSFQATNLLIAAKLVYNLGYSFSRIIEVLPELKAVPGRLQRVTEIDSAHQVFVDYAHTPEALRQSLSELKKIQNNSGELYVVFGCGGDRDSKKRPIMGKIASEIADYTIITDDNPRTENATKIRDEVASGAIKYEKVDNRKNAIINTIARLKKNDILLIAGKGHENYQIIGNKTIAFSDVKIARSVL